MPRFCHLPVTFSVISLLVLSSLVACLQTDTTTSDPTSSEPTPLFGNTEFSFDLDGNLRVDTPLPGIEFSTTDSELINLDGSCIRQATVEVANQSSSDLANLSLFGLQTDQTFTGTNVSNVRDSFGNAITVDELVQSIVAVHGRFPDGAIDPEKADMQAYVAADIARAQAFVNEFFNDNDVDSNIPLQTLSEDSNDDAKFVVLGRGYVVSNVSGQGNRAIAVGEDGIVTIAVQYPCDQNDPAGYPSSFDLSFAYVDTPAPRITQGLLEAVEAFAERIETTFDVLPPNLEVIINEGSPPPVLTAPVTVIPVPAPEPPIKSVPSGAISFQLGMQDLGIQAEDDTEVTIQVSSNVQSTTVTVGQ